MTSRCFICNLESDVFLKESLSFRIHRAEEHNHWDYCYYLVKLLMMDVEQMNGTENYVLDRYLANELTWFPVGKTQSLTEDSFDLGIDEKVFNIQELILQCTEELELQERMEQHKKQNRELEKRKRQGNRSKR